MGRAIIRVVDKQKGKRPVEYFLIVSSVVNAPITNGLRRGHMKKYLRREYGARYMRLEWKGDLERCLKTGTSEGRQLEEFVEEEMYCAGPNNGTCTVPQLIQHYCRENGGEEQAFSWME